ncbi:MAG: hypothetical protein ACT4O1_05620 [Gemmatimonadota bacterium]
MKYLRSSLLTCLVLVSTRAFAQDPQPPARDTTQVAQDTTPGILADSVRPIPQLARYFLGPAHGFSSGVWVWDRSALMLEAPVTLGDLLDRIPGILTIRSGFYVQPEAATALGGTGNRLEVWLDGYVLDPLLESSFDLAKLELANVESVRVERRPGMIRVHIETLMPADSRAYSLVEAAVGEPDANLFRGVFLIPKFFFGPLGLAIDRIDTDGLQRTEPADQFSGWAKWSYIRSGSGLQVEFRRTSTDRDPDVPWPAKYQRDDLILRARLRLLDGLVAEVFGGRSMLEIDTVTTTADNDSVPRVPEENIQWGARASFVSPRAWARGSFRVRDAEALASTQFDGAGGITFGLLAATAELTQSNWRAAGSASELTLRAEAGPFRGFRVFGETTTSDRGVPYLSGLADSIPIITSYDGIRVGGQVEWRGIVAGGALLKAKSDSVTTFGLPFDRQNRLYFGSDATGWEVSGRVPLPLINGLFAEGMVSDWYTGKVSLYMPVRQYRAGLELHAIPLRSGNLEILGRIEAIHRGSMLAPNLQAGEFDERVLTMPPLNYIDAYLQIRIMDVRAFMRYEDLAGQILAEIPKRALRGQRLFYGVKWQFFN